MISGEDEGFDRLAVRAGLTVVRWYGRLWRHAAVLFLVDTAKRTVGGASGSYPRPEGSSEVSQRSIPSNEGASTADPIVTREQDS